MIRQLQTDHLWRSQRVACGLRVLSGDQRGLWRRWWRHGVAVVSDGELRWRAGFLGTIFVLPTTREICIRVTDVDLDTLQDGIARDALSGLNPQTVSFVIHTSEATIRCACFPPAREALLRALGYPLPEGEGHP